MFTTFLAYILFHIYYSAYDIFFTFPIRLKQRNILFKRTEKEREKVEDGEREEDKRETTKNQGESFIKILFTKASSALLLQYQDYSR